MKKALGIVAIVIGVSVGIWCFMVVVRMLVYPQWGDVSQVLAFLFYVFGVGGGIALIFLGKRLRHS